MNFLEDQAQLSLLRYSFVTPHLLPADKNNDSITVPEQAPSPDNTEYEIITTFDYNHVYFSHGARCSDVQVIPYEV